MKTIIEKRQNPFPLDHFPCFGGGVRNGAGGCPHRPAQCHDRANETLNLVRACLEVLEPDFNESTDDILGKRKL